MPKARKTNATALSSELGTGDFAIDYNPKGRAIRKCRTQHRDSPFEDSAVAISDDDDDFMEEVEVDDVISTARCKKRKRSPSPEAPLPSDQIDALSESDSETSQPDIPESPAPAALAGHTTVHLTVNIPIGHQGPITLNLDPKTITQAPFYPKADRLTQSTLARLNTRSKPKTKKHAGFLDLPAELRNEIYRMIFTTQGDVNFSRPDNFSRSAALLRTCHQVHEEGNLYVFSTSHEQNIDICIQVAAYSTPRTASISNAAPNATAPSGKTNGANSASSTSANLPNPSGPQTSPSSAT